MTRKTATAPRSAAAQSARVRLTPGGYSLLSERVDEITRVRLPRMRHLLVKRERDERDVAEFERLLEEAAMLDTLLGEAEILADDPAAFEGRVELGMRVRITLADGSQAWVRPVHAAEAALDDERISVNLPLATALLGARASHVVWVAAPAGVWACTVLEIDPKVNDES
jgi:transcription elongation GreA/GreB family factor